MYSKKYVNHVSIFIILDKISSVKTFYLVLCIIFNMDKIFCKNLKDTRKACSMTQKQVAVKLGVVESCYANWEQGRTEPSIESLRALCRIFNVTADDLINN